MGYTKELREKVLRAAMLGYMRLLKKVSKGEAKRNRKGVQTLANRRFKRLIGIQEWYRVQEDKPDGWEVQEPWTREGTRRSLVTKALTEGILRASTLYHIPQNPN